MSTRYHESTSRKGAPRDLRSNEIRWEDVFKTIGWTLFLDVSPSARTVAGYIALRSGQFGLAWMREDTACAELGIHDRTWRDALRRLKEIGVLTVEHRNHGARSQTSIYTFVRCAELERIVRAHPLLLAKDP